MKTEFAILGGGIAGLTAARELLARGRKVVLIEKDAEVGGLARTIERDGFRFDIGGHRFHSNNPSVVQWLKDLLKSDLLVVPRVSRIHLEGRFVDYPIQFPGALSIFSPAKAARMVASYILAKCQERNRPEVSFEDWVVKRYGKSLHAVFFKPYTEKVWGIPCTELSAQWASQRIGLPSMWRAVKHALIPSKEVLATAVSEFYYPRTGFGMIPKALEREIIEMGGSILTDATLSQLLPGTDGSRITIRARDGVTETIEAEQVISTIPLNFLLGAIPKELGSEAVVADSHLDYRDIIVVFLALSRQRVSPDSWTYFPSKKLVFGRTHEPKNWSAEMVPSDGYTSLAVEIFSTHGEPIWNMTDDEIVTRVTDQMHEIGWIDRSDLHKYWVARVPFAYPVYRIGYEERLQRVHNYLAQWPHLHLLGRTGSFRYMNSDGVIEDVFRLMDVLSIPASDVGQLALQEGRWV